MDRVIPAPRKKRTLELDTDFITPSALTNRLLACCFALQKRKVTRATVEQALDDCVCNLASARQAFYSQVQNSGLLEVIPEPINMVMEAFKEYEQALTSAKTGLDNLQFNPLDSLAVLIRDSYLTLYDALLAYEWAYMGQGDEPHPALNLLQKTISAAQQQLMPDDRLNDILDRLWDYFVGEQENAEQGISDPVQRDRRVSAIQQALSGIQMMDGYFERYDINYLLSGYARCHQGCLLIIEQLQESTGEALADTPTPSPQVNWVIHTAKAVVDGLSTDLLTKAQAWFEPQLNESFFRFEQYASVAVENSDTPTQVLEQIPVARDGYNRLNRALPLLRLGVERRHLLLKAIQYLEEGAQLIFQSWEKFEALEQTESLIACVRCGAQNDSEARVCSRCGAQLLRSAQEGVRVSLNQPQAQVTTQSSGLDNAPKPPAHIARLLNAVDNARSGAILPADFQAEILWGQKLLQTAIQNTSRLPQSSAQAEVNEALQSLRQGLREFNLALKEMASYLNDYHPSHLDASAELLYKACSIFTALQKISAAKK